jgi:hypothetical protein
MCARRWFVCRGGLPREPPHRESSDCDGSRDTDEDVCDDDEPVSSGTPQASLTSLLDHVSSIGSRHGDPCSRSIGHDGQDLRGPTSRPPEIQRARLEQPRSPGIPMKRVPCDLAARQCPPFGRAQIRRLTRDKRLRTVVHTPRYVPHPSMCPRCAQHLARVYLRAFVGGHAIVRPDELCSTCQVRLQEFARCHRREVA